MSSAPAGAVTQRHEVIVSDETVRPTGRITELASAYGRYGYRRVTALLHAEGWRSCS